MKILVISDVYKPHIDGVAVSVENSVKYMQKYGHEVCLLTLSYSGKEEHIKENNLTIHRYNSVPLPSYENFRVCIPDIKHISNVIRSFRPDFVHIHTFPGILALVSFYYAKRYNIPIIATYHSSYPDVIMYFSPIRLLKLDRYILRASTKLENLSPEKLNALFLQFRKKIGSIRPSGLKKVSRKTVWKLTNNYFNRCDLVIAPSQAIEENLTKYGVMTKIVRVSNGIELSKFEPKNTYAKKITRIIHVGRLGFEKKVDVILDALVKIKHEFEFSIVGDGPARLLLEKKAKDLGIGSKVKFIGFVDRKDLPKLYRSHDFFVTASEMETQGIVLLEAMACGLPCIGPDVLAVPNLVKHNRTGLIFQSGNRKQFVWSINNFLKNPKYVEKYGKNARREAEKHDIAKVMLRLEKTYKRLVESTYDVCLYSETEYMGVSGVATAFENQKKSLKLNNVKYTTNPKDKYDVLHLNTPGPLAIRLARSARKKGIPVVISAHSTQEDIRNTLVLSNLASTLVKKYLIKAYNNADALICPSEYTKNLLKSYGITKKIYVMSNGIDLQNFKTSDVRRKHFRDHFGLDSIVVFSVGHVFVRKGIVDFIDIARKMPELKFIWTGKLFSKILAYNQKMEKAIHTAPDNFQFTGYVKDILDVYSGGDIFLFPSYEENQGIAILEAAACAKPIIIRDLSVYKGWLVHGKNCFKAKNIREFKKFTRRLSEDAELRNKMEKAAHQMSKMHDLRIVGKKLKKIYSIA